MVKRHVQRQRQPYASTLPRRIQVIFSQVARSVVVGLVAWLFHGPRLMCGEILSKRGIRWARGEKYVDFDRGKSRDMCLNVRHIFSESLQAMESPTPQTPRRRSPLASILARTMSSIHASSQPAPAFVLATIVRSVLLQKFHVQLVFPVTLVLLHVDLVRRRSAWHLPRRLPNRLNQRAPGPILNSSCLFVWPVCALQVSGRGLA